MRLKWQIILQSNLENFYVQNHQYSWNFCNHFFSSFHLCHINKYNHWIWRLWVLIRDRKTVIVIFNVLLMEIRGFIFMINFPFLQKKSKLFLILWEKTIVMYLLAFWSKGGFIHRLFSTVNCTLFQIFRNKFREN